MTRIHPSPTKRVSGIPRRALFKFTVLALVVAGTFAAARWGPLAGFLDRDTLAATLESLRQRWWSPLALIALFAFLCPLGVPSSPMIVVGGVVFGTAAGAFYSVTGNLLAACITYWIGRTLGRDLVAHLGGSRLKKVQRLLEKKGFWSLARIRLLPIPFPLVNYAAAFAGVRFPTFFITSFLGLTPAVVAFTWLSATLMEATDGQRSEVFFRFALALALFLALSFIPSALQARSRKRRYRDLREARRTR